MFLPPDPPIPEYDPCAGKISTVERTLSKMKAAAYRVGFNLWHIFQPLDEHKTNFISESKFLSVLLGPMKAIIGLDVFEVGELAENFKIDDGRIAYTRLCQQVHGKLSPPGQSDEDRHKELMRSNNLGPNEEKMVTDLLGRISVTVTPRRVVVMPYFQDYELVQKDSGMVTKNTFVRVLNFMDASLSADEIALLIQKYRHDSDTIKYKAFIIELDQITDFLRDHDYVDLYGGLRDDFLGEMPKLPEIDMKPVPHGEHLGIQKVWREDWEGGQITATQTAAVFDKVKDHVHRERLRIKDYFVHYDKEICGRVSSEIFRACFKWLIISETSFNDLYLTRKEIDLLVSIYQDPFYTHDSLWKVFQDDLEKDVDPEELERWPTRGLERISVDPLMVLCRPPTPPQEEIPLTIEDVFQHIHECMTTMDSARGLFGVLAKRDLDKSGYLTTAQFEWAIVECGIFLTPEEVEILRCRYGNETSVHWRYFAEDMSAYQASLHEDRQQMELENRRKVIDEEKRQQLEMMESNVVEILAKIKCFIICKRVWINDYLKIFDKHKKNLITRSEFERGLDQCGIKLSRKELDVLLNVFSLPTEPEMIEYSRFCRTVDEDSIPPCLVKPKLEEVITKSAELESRQLPVHQWANFKQRRLVATAMEKLSKYVGLANTDLFKGLDRNNSGSISRYALQNALLSLNCLHLITNKELDTIIHCFGFKKGHFTELDYMSFLNGLDIVVKTKKAAKNL